MLDRPRQQSSWSVRPSDSGIDRFASGTAANVLWLVARCLIGGLFVQGGGVKLMALDAFAASLAKNGVPMADIAAAIGAAVEFGGGLAIVVGLQTRYAAPLMVAFTIIATLISHRFWEFADAARRQQSVPVREERRHYRRLSPAVRPRRRTLEFGWLVATARACQP